MGLPGRLFASTLDVCSDLAGSDLDLISLVQSFLEKTGRPTEVMVGRDMFVERA